MPHMDTRIAIKQATQGHKRSYQQAITLGLNATSVAINKLLLWL